MFTKQLSPYIIYKVYEIDVSFCRVPCPQFFSYDYIPGVLKHQCIAVMMPVYRHYQAVPSEIKRHSIPNIATCRIQQTFPTIEHNHRNMRCTKRSHHEHTRIKTGICSIRIGHSPSNQCYIN
ncbi:hypothetical protein HMPREF1199_00625 [Hoylesella oralis CC98A]|nr:hypothetical protein HMPREF1199_00625 [Hoylesella oralis CC98A]